MKKAIILAALSIAACVSACDNGTEETPEPATEAPAETQPEANEETPAKAPGRLTVEGMIAERERLERISVEGELTFEIDGEAQAWNHLPQPDNVITRISTALGAKPSADSEDRLSITLTQFNLAETELPAEVKTEPPGRTAASVFQRLQTVMQLRRGEHQYNARPTVHLESYAGGFLTGRIEDIRMGHNDGGEAVEITNLRFRIQARGTDAATNAALEALMGAAN